MSAQKSCPPEVVELAAKGLAAKALLDMYGLGSLSELRGMVDGLRATVSLGTPPLSAGFIQWLERRVALADAAIEAAQEVIGQCDCGMDEPPPNPKKAWREARDAYYAAGGPTGGAL